MERQLRDKVFALFWIIRRFLTTYRAFLSHPRSSFSNYFSSPSQFTKPGFFLLANICFSFLLGHLIGYELPPFPLDLSFLQIPGSYPVVIFRFLLGIYVFLLIFKWLIRYKNFNSFFLTVLPIFCFSSVVYLPILFVKNYYLGIIGQDFFELFSNFLNGVWPKFLAWTLVKYLLFPPLIFLTLMGWWLLLIHTGLTFSKLRSLNLRRKLALACILFFVLQSLTALAATTTKNWSLLCNVKTLFFKDIEAALNERPPNFFKAGILAGDISDDEDIPVFLRYVFKLKKASYLLATPIFFEGDTEFTRQVLRELDLKEYASVKSLLTAHLDAFSSDRKNPRRQSFLQLENDLKEAEKLYNSPGFVDLGETGRMEVSFTFWIWNTSNRYSVDPQDKTIRILIAVQPSWITLFP
jgi:hypothetical protein